MKWSKWLEKWELSSLKIKTPFADMEWTPQDEDKTAAWEMYIELLTRISTQPLPDQHGDEASALNSFESKNQTLHRQMASIIVARCIRKRNSMH